MRRFWLCMIACSAACSAAADDPVDSVMGNWEGIWRTNDGDSGKVSAKVMALGDTQYESAFVLVEPDGTERAFRVPLTGTRHGESISFGSKVDLGSDRGGVFEWSAEVAGGKFSGKFTGNESGTITMDRVLHKSPTLGAKPPAGAIVLFDGTNLDQWQSRNGGPANWAIKDGAMEVSPRTPGGPRGDIVSKPTFGSHKLHLEFRTPFMPKARGQARGNSGVYVQGRYEVQVLDSFGLPPRDNEAGGIYSQATPKSNASLPPGEWQTYDIAFRAARVDANNKLVEPALITVDFNGVRIHDAVKLTRPTPGGVDADAGGKGALLLQDHGNPVQFRNIWVVPGEGS